MKTSKYINVTQLNKTKKYTNNFCEKMKIRNINVTFCVIVNDKISVKFFKATYLLNVLLN